LKGMTEAVSVIDAEIEDAQATLAEIDQVIEGARERRREQVATIRRLTNARATLTGERKRNGAKRTGRAKAGPAAVEKVRKTLAEDLDGRATQAAITHATKLNSGQVSAAIQALAADGIIRETGVRVGRTKEVEIVGNGPLRRRARAAAVA
jgi:F0F1-type ATP synthase membrane subunit b/b'